MISSMDAFDEAGKLFVILQDDVERLKSRLAEEDCQLNRRSFVRAIFSLIEGMTYSLKRMAYEKTLTGTSQLSSADISMLKEETYDLGRKGNPVTIPKPLPLKKNVRFTFSIFSQVYQINFIPKFDGPGWNSLLRAYAVRNRLMHPKGPSDLEVSASELNAAFRAYAWFVWNVIATLCEAVEALLSEEARLERELRALYQASEPVESQRILTPRGFASGKERNAVKARLDEIRKRLLEAERDWSR